MHEEPLPPVVFFTLKDLKEMKRFPRSPQDRHLQIQLDHINRDNSFLIFLSHNWDRGYEGAKDYHIVVDPLAEPMPHPDTAGHDKMKLIISALCKMKISFCPTIADEDILLWVDYGCIHQDASACLELQMLDQIIGVCDAMLTIIYDEKIDTAWGDQLRTTGINDVFAQYGSPKWNQGNYSYIARGWTRVEMLLCSNIPVVKSSTKRKAKFKHAMRACQEEGRRPHILYGTNEEIRNFPPRVLPPMQNSWFIKYNPVFGNLTKESDRQAIIALVDSINVVQIKRTYDGICDEYGYPHGKGKMIFANGDEFVGYYHHGEQHGKGCFTFANGNMFRGEYHHGRRHGKGVYKWSDGRIFSGNYVDNKQHGRGLYFFPNGDYYVGEYQRGKRHGKGKYRYANGGLYAGDYLDGDRTGIGIQKNADGIIVHCGKWYRNEPEGKCWSELTIYLKHHFSDVHEWNLKSIFLLVSAMIIFFALYSKTNASHYLVTIATPREGFQMTVTYWMLTGIVIAVLYS